MKAVAKSKARKARQTEPQFFMYKGVKHYIGRPPPGKGKIPMKKIRQMMDEIVAARTKPILPP